MAGHPAELVFRTNKAGRSKLEADWLRQLKGWPYSGECLKCIPEDRSEGALEAVFVAQTHRMGLVYLQRKDDQFFHIFRHADGKKCTAAQFTGYPAPAEASEQDGALSDL